MKKIIEFLFILCLFVCTTFKMNGQNDYSQHFEIISQASALSDENKYEDALNLIRSNDELFHVDIVAKFWYDWFNGILLYRTEKYTEARRFIADAISFIDANADDLAGSNMDMFLPIYYHAVLIDLNEGVHKDVLIAELEHAKYIYEKADATSSPVYPLITSDLESLKNNPASLAVEAMADFVAGRYQQAIPKLEIVVDDCKIYRPTDYVTLTNWMKALAMSYMNVGDYNNSEQIFSEAINIFESNNLQNERTYRIMLDAASVLYVYMQNYNAANLLNSRAKTLFEEALDFGEEYVRCLSNGALVQNGLGHKSMAKLLLDVALRQAKENLSDTTSISSAFVAANQYADNPVDLATIDANYFVQTRIIPYVTILSNASTLYSDLGYFSEAEKAVKESIRISEEYDLKEALPYNNLGMLYMYESDFKEATEWFLKGCSLAETPYESDEIGMNVAMGMYLSNNPAAAQFCSEYSAGTRSNIRNMFAFMSGEERAIYWKHFEFYLPMINLFIYESGKNEFFGAIYDNILEAKGLLLRSTNAIRDAILNSGNDNDRADFARISQLKQQLEVEKDEANRNSMAKEIEAIDKRLARSVNTYADFAAANSISWNNVRDALSANDIAIEFYNIPEVWGLDSIQTFTGEPRYCAVMLKKDFDYPKIIPLCKECVLENLDNIDIYETDSLYHYIWQPLETELKGIKNIYFTADRELHKIGIEYVPTPDGRTVGDIYNFYRLSSTRNLAERTKIANSKNAVLYGGLRYDTDKADLIAESRSSGCRSDETSRAELGNARYSIEYPQYLPGTLKEVECIAKNFSNKPRLLTGMSGTEESFKALAGSSVDILHLATHGFFWAQEDADNHSFVSFLNRKNGKPSTDEDLALMRSGLFLSGSNICLRGEELPADVEDGVLTALELSNLNLGNVDMVVMSACESGLGETSSEGVFGLQRGFKLAGAKTLLMSLWKVDDDATQILMTEFYRNYLSGKTKHESLRLAQHSLRNTPIYNNPYYWAAFILLDALN